MAGKSEADPDQAESKPKRRKGKASAKPRRLRRGRPLTPLVPRAVVKASAAQLVAVAS